MAGQPLIVLVAVLGRDDQLGNGAAKHGSPRVAEDVLRGGVPFDNQALAGDGYDAVESGVQDRTLQALAVAQRGYDALALGPHHSAAVGKPDDGSGIGREQDDIRKVSWIGDDP